MGKLDGLENITLAVQGRVARRDHRAVYPKSLRGGDDCGCPDRKCSACHEAAMHRRYHCEGCSHTVGFLCG